MLVSLNWLKEFVDISDKTAEEIAELLTMGGIEVEGINRVGHDLENVLTARILEIKPHPSADKLRLARVGLGELDLTVVCGAPNIEVGQIVAYAGPGTVLPSGFAIEERKIKGIVSPGMICSEKELGLGDDAAGVLVLDGSLKVGAPLATAMPFIKDEILETSVTPNRGDWLSVLGTAREVAALLDRKWSEPGFELKEIETPTSSKITVELPDPDLCPRYVASMVLGVKIGPSPLKFRLRLTRSGVRPISNIVDATNLILLECGQPLHAFDYDLLQDQKIVVRRCKPGEVFTTLDGAERKLPEGALMIMDGRRSVALAGIMGGINSEISDSTSNVLIESACFEPFGIRRTSKAMGLSTEASYRFERGIDPEGSLRAARHCAHLVQTLAGGGITIGVVDAYPTPIVRKPVSANPAKIGALLGVELSAAQIAGYLARLGIGVESREKELICTPPSWRWDLERDVDMAEEAARVHGYQNIPVSTPNIKSAPDYTRERPELLRKVRRAMNASGFTEIVTMSFVSKDSGAEFDIEKVEPLALMNPLTEDFAVMRTSLIPGLLSVMKRNFNFRNEDLKLFELGGTFVPVKDQELPREDLKLSGLAVGSRYPALWNLPRNEQVDFYDVKGALENLCEALHVPEPVFSKSEVAFLHPGKSADMFVNDIKVGYLGEISPAKASQHDLDKKVYIFELMLEPLLAEISKENVFKPLDRYPYIERDLSIIVEEKVSGELIKHLISRLRHDIIRSVNLFDLYQGESIPRGQKSMAFRVRYQSDERTLTDEEVQEVHSRIVDALREEFGATTRE